MEDALNESQPVCPICGEECQCDPPPDWDALKQEADALLAVANPICEDAAARKKETLLAMAPVTKLVQ